LDMKPSYIFAFHFRAAGWVVLLMSVCMFQYSSSLQHRSWTSYNLQAV